MSETETNTKYVTVERSTALGTQLKLTLEALEHEQVRIVEYYRQPKNGQKFMRNKSQEGQIVPFEQLKLNKSFQELFTPDTSDAQDTEENMTEKEAA